MRSVRIGAVRGESDAEGRYRLAGVPLGVKALYLSHPAYKGKAQEVDVQPGENRVDVMLERGATVSGRVVDKAGTPKIGAALTLRNRGERGPRGYRASEPAPTAASRSSRSPTAASTSRPRPTASRQRSIPPSIEVAGRDVDGIELVLRRGVTLFGRIRGLDPAQMAAVEVTAERTDRAGRPERSGTVDHEGRYEITALEAGDWHLRARLAGGRREAEAWVTIAAGDRKVERDLKLGGGLALSGLVLLEDRPLPQSHVSLRGLDVTAERGVTTDHQGAFRIEDLEPGRYRVEVVHGERMLSHTEDLELAADREVVIEIATAVLSGTVVAAGSGEGVADALVYLEGLRGGAGSSLTTVGTNAAGAFVTASLDPGRYRLTVRGNGYAPEERIVDAEAGVAAEPLMIELKPTAGLTLTVRRASAASRRCGRPSSCSTRAGRAGPRRGAAPERPRLWLSPAGPARPMDRPGQGNRFSHRARQSHRPRRAAGGDVAPRIDADGARPGAPRLPRRRRPDPRRCGRYPLLRHQSRRVLPAVLAVDRRRGHRRRRPRRCVAAGGHRRRWPGVDRLRGHDRRDGGDCGDSMSVGTPGFQPGVGRPRASLFVVLCTRHRAVRFCWTDEVSKTAGGGEAPRRFTSRRAQLRRCLRHLGRLRLAAPAQGGDAELHQLLAARPTSPRMTARASMARFWAAATAVLRSWVTFCLSAISVFRVVLSVRIVVIAVSRGARNFSTPGTRDRCLTMDSRSCSRFRTCWESWSAWAFSFLGSNPGSGLAAPAAGPRVEGMAGGLRPAKDAVLLSHDEPPGS